jgi:hypothetical protein
MKKEAETETGVKGMKWGTGRKRPGFQKGYVNSGRDEDGEITWVPKGAGLSKAERTEQGRKTGDKEYNL